jgi:psiF repeat
MHRYALVAGGLFVFSLGMLPGAPAVAVTAKQKMETCKFGADDQKLTGKDRAVFLKKCMSNANDPRGPAVGAAPASGPADVPDAPPTEGEPKD